ncbi:hypothetical protein DRO42_08260, partial [Candidatus Bathyarchaeota archaeon]
MNLRDFCYAYFGWMGRSLSKVFRGMEQDLDAAYMKVHPEVYFSVVGFVAFLSLAIPFTLSMFVLLGLWPSLPFLPMGGLMIIPFSAIIPVLVIVLGVVMPKTAASNRVS